MYLVQFANGAVYIGISTVDCASRLQAHGTRWDDVVAVRLMPFPGATAALRLRERDLVHAAEKAGVVVRNREHALHFEGSSTLDQLVDVDLQAEWLDDPARVNAADTARPVILPVSQVEAYADRYKRFEQRPDHRDLLDALGTYLQHTMPLPSRTEASFWSVSCHPTSNKQRIACVNVNQMETLVILQPDVSDDIHAFVNVDQTELPANRLRRRWFLMRRGIRTGAGRYASGGTNQIQLVVDGRAALTRMLNDTEIQRAAASFNLHLMRKGPCRHTKAHCAQLAAAALSRARVARVQ
ncbi:hypothetical protein ACFTSD_11930 [Nocardiaceae bacterium NPDC056970]